MVKLFESNNALVGSHIKAMNRFLNIDHHALHHIERDKHTDKFVRYSTFDGELY